MGITPHPAHVAGQKRQQRRDKDQQPDSAQQLGHRRDHFARAEPAHSQRAEEQREQECSDAEALQQQVGDHGSDDADPVARRARTGQDRGAIQRRIERRIGSQREKKKERGDTQQEPDQLVEPAVVGRSENPGNILHWA